MIFDFPNNAVYLSPNSQFSAPEVFNRSGINCIRREKLIVVNAVVEDSPAMKAGVRAGDILKKVGNGKAYESTLPRMFQMFGVPQGPVTVYVQRDDREKEFVLDWTDPPPLVPPAPSKKKFLEIED